VALTAVDSVPLTDLQCGYLLGRKNLFSLGGVSCHVYMEFSCPTLDINALQCAWSTVHQMHPAMHSSYQDHGCAIVNRTYDAHVTIVDLSGMSLTEQETVQEQTRSRLCQNLRVVQEGDVCGLTLLRKDDANSILIFDWDLVAGDVKSFQIVLTDLARHYQTNGSAASVFEDACIAKQQVKGSADYRAASEYWAKKAELFPSPYKLNGMRDPQELKGARYISADAFIDRGTWSSLKAVAQNHGISKETALLGAFYAAMRPLSDSDDCIVSVPTFYRQEEENGCVGDFTNIVLEHIRTRGGQTVDSQLSEMEEERRTNCNHWAYDGIEVQKLIKQKFPERKWIAPIVFAPSLDMDLVDRVFIDCIGELRFMISQTPQVWLDAQAFEYDSRLLLSLVYPEGLYPQHLIEGLLAAYTQNIAKLASAKFWDKGFDELY